MSIDPVVGMEVSGLVGSSAKVLTDSGLRGAQIANALSNQGVAVEIESPSSKLAAGFHKSSVPEQVQPRPSLTPAPVFAQNLGRNA